ncbi:MAG: hypothetical protein KC431_06255 [Myxococcales bacterium]|nr:hypothetical protein [Myxococcales bacterium]
MLALGLLVGACERRVDEGKAAPTPEPTPEPAVSESGDSGDSGESGDPLSGEAAHTIPFADRTSMGYLLLLPAGPEPKVPTRATLRGLVEQAFPDRRRDGEIDLLLTLIDTEPHATDFGTLELPNFDDVADEESGADKRETIEVDPTEAVAKRERARSFDLLGLHIELVRLGLGEDTTIPASALADPVLTRDLSPAERESLPGRGWALLLRADYRNQHDVRGLRLHQTLVRVVAEHYGALIHDPDTLETMSVQAFTDRRLRASAGNVADQLAIVPFPDPHREGGVRLATRGMRRFGCVDLELDGLDADPQMLQQASDLLAGLAAILAKEGEVDASGLAVVVPEELEVTRAAIEGSYEARPRTLLSCGDCEGRAVVHLVERPPEDHDPQGHVVARVVAPRTDSDEADYDHPHWVREALGQLFGDAGFAAPRP